MADSIAKQMKPYEAVRTLDRTALPRIYTVGIAEAYRAALLQHEALFPKVEVRKEFQAALFKVTVRR